MRAHSKHVAAITLSLAMLTSVVKAETISYADAMTTLTRDCGADIKKLCKGLNLGGGRIADCMAQNAAKISPTCSASATAVFSSIQTREAAQTNYEKVCKHDMLQRCKSVKGDGYILACLIKAERRVGDKCNQAITDAGWR